LAKEGLGGKEDAFLKNLCKKKPMNQKGQMKSPKIKKSMDESYVLPSEAGTGQRVWGNKELT